MQYSGEAVTEFVCPPGHKHAEVGTCYVIHKCRCSPCRAARSRAEARRNRLKAYGRYDNGLVDAGPVRDHIAYLQAYGMGWKRISAVSGVGATAVESLIYGRKGGASDPRKGEVLQRTTRAKAEKILAVRPELHLLAGGALVPSLGTHRRVQALVTRGWSLSKIAVRVDMTRANFGGMMQRGMVRASVARKVIAVYEQLWNTPPPHTEWRDLSAFNRSQRYAAQRRWVAPLGWDDIDTDEQPPADDVAAGGVDDMAVELALAGESVRLSAAERRVAVERLWAVRWSDARIAERLGLAPRTVLRIRKELALEAFDLSELVQAGAA